MVRLFDIKKEGLSEEEGVKELYDVERGRVEWIKFKKLRKKENKEKLWKMLEKFREREEIKKSEFEDEFEETLFWIEENVLFYNPVKGIIKPQSRLLWKIMREL